MTHPTSRTENSDEIDRLRAVNAKLLTALDELLTRAAVIENRLDADIAVDSHVRSKLASAVSQARAAVARATEGQS